eukprot:CAMPEP_0195063308 /NCGR_PEP_ID=MMETSP0448-20130528/9700_1 /TAXON_ID=66468 /ORGANISM="Heterocapsa triquestra, Strain CCMP 448" /LENGTH=106 /DNA_ID=CAMNT_0040094159 /DNA_START=1218 /DNA_END=1539 /DNA_ORIENTATION=+
MGSAPARDVHVVVPAAETERVDDLHKVLLRDTARQVPDDERPPTLDVAVDTLDVALSGHRGHHARHWGLKSSALMSGMLVLLPLLSVFVVFMRSISEPDRAHNVER